MNTLLRNVFLTPLIDESKIIHNGPIQPVKDNAVTVCFSSSNEYAPFLCITISSIIQNASSNHFYDIVILTTDMSENNKSIISRFVEQAPNFSIRFMNIKHFVEDKTFYTWAHFTAFTYYRLLIPDLFCKYEKVIYLDSDIVINVDIANLFDYDIDGYLLAAVQDSHVMGRINPKHPSYSDSDYYLDVLKADVYGYFQAGVMLINIKEFAHRFAPGELIEKAGQSHYRWLDQDLLNVECQGHVKRLQNNWNVMIINNPKKIDEEYLPDEDYNAYMAARRDPWVIHYVGRAIPCFNPSADLYSYYWPYARNTPYYEILISKMIAQAEARVRHKQTLKQQIKSEWVMPAINKLLPPGSRRRKVLKRLYFKLRGWEV